MLNDQMCAKSKKVVFWGVSALIFGILTFSGCCSKQKVVEKWSDRLIIEERIDTNVVIQGAEFSDIAPLDRLQAGIKHTIEHDLALITIHIDTAKNTLRTDIIVPDREVLVEQKKTTTFESEGSRRDVVKSPSRLVPWWILMISGAVIALFAAHQLGFLRKPLRRHRG